MKKMILPLAAASVLLSSLSITAHPHRYHDAHKPIQTLSQSTAIDLNTATIRELTSLKSIGPKKAAAIVSYRKAHGPFQSLHGLTGVKGISEKWIERLKTRNPGRIHCSKPEDTEIAE